jgi:hypothetical protein
MQARPRRNSCCPLSPDRRSRYHGDLFFLPNSPAVRVTSIARASPEVAPWKKSDVTAAEPIADSSCRIELTKPRVCVCSGGDRAGQTFPTVVSFGTFL